MKDGIFEIGDIVQHKASKEKGVIIDRSTVCFTHQTISECLLALVKDSEGCVRIPDGESYTVSSVFNNPITVPGVTLELVPTGDSSCANTRKSCSTCDQRFKFHDGSCMSRMLNWFNDPRWDLEVDSCSRWGKPAK